MYWCPSFSLIQFLNHSFNSWGGIRINIEACKYVLLWADHTLLTVHRVVTGGSMISTIEHASLTVAVFIHPVSPPFLLSPLPFSMKHPWNHGQLLSVARQREGNSLGYSELTGQQAGYADFSRSPHQLWGMALMQSKCPQLYGFQHITARAWWRLIHFQGNEPPKTNYFLNIRLYNRLVAVNHKVKYLLSQFICRISGSLLV